MKPTDKDVERARKIVGDTWRQNLKLPITGPTMVDRITQALADERERCAVVAESNIYLMYLTKSDLPTMDRDAKVRQQARNEVAKVIREGA